MAVFNEVIAMLIRADTRGAVSELRNLWGQADQTATAWDKAGKKIGVTGSQLKGGLAAVGTVAGTIATAMKLTADAYVAAADGASMLSKVTNSTVEDASRFNAVASAMGLEMNDLVEIFADFQQATAKSPQGLAQLGVALTKNSKGQTDWVATATDFMTAVQGIGDATQRNALMFQYFGEEGAKQLMALLNAGQSLEQALAAIPDSMIINPEGVQNAQDYQQAMKELKTTVDGLTIGLGSGLVPALVDTAAGFQVLVDGINALPGDALEALGAVAIGPLASGLALVGKLFGDDAEAAADLATATTQAATAQESLTAVIASGATSGQDFANAVRAAGDELAAQESNARLAAQALDVYRASTDQAYESTLKLLGLGRSERSAQRAAEGAADSAGDAKAAMDKALADAKVAKTVVENIAAIRGRERKKTEQEGIIAGSTDVAEIEGIKGRAAGKKTRVIEAAGVITPAEARQIREATRTYEQSLDDIAAAWEAVADARIKHQEALGKYLTEAEKLDIVRQELQKGLDTPGLSEKAKAGIRADLAEVEKNIKKLGGVPIEIDGIKFKGGTDEKAARDLMARIQVAIRNRDFGMAERLSNELETAKVTGPADLNVALGLDPASVAASQAALANLGTDPKTGKPYTAKTVATVDKTKAQTDLDNLTKPRTVTVTVNYVPGTGGTGTGGLGGTGGYTPAPPPIHFPVAAPVSFSPTIISNYPKPERTSDSIASALRTAKYVVGL